MHLPLLVEFLEVGERKNKGGKKRETRERDRGRGEEKGGEEGREGENFLEHLSSFFFPHLFPFHPLLSLLSSPFLLSFLFSFEGGFHVAQGGLDLSM